MSKAHPASTLALLVAMTLSFACATVKETPQAKPAATLEGWYQALVDKKPEQSHAYLDRPARKQLPLEGFKRYYYKHRKYLIAQARNWIALARDKKPLEEAWVQVGDVQFRLIKTRDGWRIKSVRGK